jgi:predicted nucleic acid-binding protein
VGSARLAAVSDTGPLIHLAEIGCLALLTIFEELHIPEGVWLEADRPSTIRTDLTFAKRHVLPRDEINRFTADHGLEKLQAGERESLLLCSKLTVPVLLTDDLAVRRTAKAHGLTPVGSLGIIARAHYMGRITSDAAEKHLRELYTVSSLFVTETIVDLAIERLRGG